MGCGGSRTRVHTAGGRLVRSMYTMGFEDCANILSMEHSMIEMKKVMSMVVGNEIKGAKDFQEKHENKQMKLQKRTLEKLWDAHVKANINGPNTADKKDNTLEPTVVRVLVQDFLDGSWDCAHGLQRSLFGAIFGILVPVAIANGMSEKEIEKKRKKAWAEVKNHTQMYFDGLESKPEKVQKIVDEIPTIDVTIVRPPKTKTDEPTEEKVKKISWEEFVKMFQKSDLAKIHDSNKILFDLTPLLHEVIEWKLVHAHGKDQA